MGNPISTLFTFQPYNRTCIIHNHSYTRLKPPIRYYQQTNNILTYDNSKRIARAETKTLRLHLEP